MIDYVNLFLAGVNLIIGIKNENWNAVFGWVAAILYILIKIRF